jgi:putative NADPH-quinone reductase
MSVTDSTHDVPRALLVVAHPRSDSLTARSAGRAREHLEKRGLTVDLLDLHAEGFDPRMTVRDEPDWADPDKRYSDEVRAHIKRVDAADVIVVVFPVWWFSVPAIVKGWVDRVWNNGFAYGREPSRLAGKRMLWLGLAGGSQQAYAAQGLEAMMDRQLRMGISGYCGIEDAALRMIFDITPEQAPPLEELTTMVLTRTDEIMTEFLDGDGVG